jgi:hypothetical protein
MQTKLNEDNPSTFVLPEDIPSSEFTSEALFIGNWKRVSEQKDVLMVKPEELWEKYLGFLGLDIKTTSFHWFLRVVIHVIVFFFVAGILIWQSGFPNVPTRDEFPYAVNFVIIFLAVLSTLFMIVWVVENARLCERLIDNLSAKPSEWTKKARILAEVKKWSRRNVWMTGWILIWLPV